MPSSAINTDFSSWAAESLAASKSVVYPGFTEHEDPTDAYKEAAKPVACERLMYAGARLANLIEEIYGSSTQQAETFLQ